MLLRNCVRDMSVGERIRITATDPTTRKDFSDYCHFLGHRLLYASQEAELYVYVVEKGGA